MLNQARILKVFIIREERAKFLPKAYRKICGYKNNRKSGINKVEWWKNGKLEEWNAVVYLKRSVKSMVFAFLS